MPKQYWLMKSEPEAYSIDDLKKDKKTEWDGIRNYQARNFMMNDMKLGDAVIFYHSNATPPGAAGLAEVCAKAHVDSTALDKKSKYFDKRASKEKPMWYCVDVKFKERFAELVSLADLRENKKLQGMQLLKKGNRLSILPLKKSEFDEICRMASKAAKQR